MTEEELRKQLSQCRELALAHLEQMQELLQRSDRPHYSLSQQVNVCAHKVRRIEIGEPSESTTTTEPG